MAISTAITTTHLLKRTTAAPFLLSYRNYSRVLVNNYHHHCCSSFPGVIRPAPFVSHSRPALAICGSDSKSAAARRIRRIQLLCHSTEAEAQTTQASGSSADTASTATTSDGDASKEETSVREAANTLDIRVGKILKAWRHEEADSLYVEEVDVGEPEPRTICSGLVKYVPVHHLQEKNVIVLANLKPRNMRGVKSFGMLMAASDASHENVELLVPPEGAVPGDRVWFGSVDEQEKLPDVASPNQVQKKKIWELVQPHLRTDESCVAHLGVHPMQTSAGVVTSQSLKNANIS